MARSIWSGAISFGLVNVPVKLYTAVSRKAVRFHQLHDADHMRIQQKRVCPKDGEEVAYDNIVKGYELSPDRYVVIEPEELESLDPKKTRSIDIEDFVELDQIDPVYYDHPYYVLPDKGADKAYNLLLTAMRESGRVAIARVVLRSKEYLTAIRPTGDVLMMATMLFADEVVPQDALDALPEADAEASEREVTMARQLIESLSGDFEPDKYHDQYRERVLDLIERKAEGQEITIQPEEEPAKVPDPMAALEASVAAARDRPAGGAGAEDGAAGGDGKPAGKRRSASSAKKNGASNGRRSGSGAASGKSRGSAAGSGAASAKSGAASGKSGAAGGKSRSGGKKGAKAKKDA